MSNLNEPQPSTSQEHPKRRISPEQPKRQVHPVIEIVNGYKHYGISKKWHQVIKNFNLTAYSGEIYALLGPHGAGKTTVLNIILGITKLNGGFVKIFGFTPGETLSGIPGLRVGFSPQSYGLYPEFTINEIFRYYGKLLKLGSNYIEEKITYLSEVLYLPEGNFFIKNCTEAEKRQISFAVAILHEPELLILDEPCGGVDPVLANSIWELLRNLVEEHQITVFLTTQNLLDAHRADKIGIMRSGYLLMEGNERTLLTSYEIENLESLYLHIYSLRVRKNLVRETKSIEDNPLIVVEKLASSGSEGFIYIGEIEQPQSDIRVKKAVDWAALKRHLKLLPSFKRIGILIIRDFYRSFRNYIWLLSFFLLPILLIILFSFTIGTTPKNLNLAVVNFEASESDCHDMYEKFISCQILDLINTKVVNLIHFENYESARKQALNLKALGIMIFGESFTNEIARTIADITYDNVNFHNPETSQLILTLDMTSKIVATTIEQTVKKAVETYLKMATKGMTAHNASIGFPIKIADPIFGHAESADTEFITTGLSVTLIYHMATFVSALTLILDRTMRTAARDYMAGVKLTESVISQMAVYGTILFVEAVLMFIALIGIRHLTVHGSLPCLILIIIIQIWCGLCLGFLLANTCATAVHASYVVFTFLSASLILCGILWPQDGQPRWLLIFVKLLPQTQAIYAVRCIVQRGISMDHEEVYLGTIIPLIWIVLFIFCSVLIQKISY